MRFTLLLTVGLSLIGASAVYADSGSCADCYRPNVADPAGVITTTSAHCYWTDDGQSGSCYTLQASFNSCETSKATYCPVKSGGGTTGGGGAGSGGSTCSTGATGACPPDCSGCSGGGEKY